MIVWRISHEEMMYPYQLQSGKAVSPLHLRPPQEFCQLCVRKCSENPLSSLVLFTRKSTLNVNSMYIWRGAIKSRHQWQFSVTVRSGIVGDCFVGSYVLHHRLNAPITAICGAHFVTAAGYSTKELVYARRCPSPVQLHWQKSLGDRLHCANDKTGTAIPANFVTRPEPPQLCSFGDTENCDVRFSG